MGMRFCANCGASISVRIPEGDNFARHVCDACGTVFYQNPRVVVGCIPEWGERILLCRRAIEPRYGFWTFPAGYLENGETIQHAAARETLEEASARVQIESIFAVLNLPAYHQVHIMFRGRLLDLDYAAGSESLEVALLRREEIPWDQLAFATVRETLEHYYSDRTRQNFDFHLIDIALPD